MSIVIYIAPGYGDDPGQARIYRADFAHPDGPENVAAHYRQHPERWKEVGLMNFEGKLVCFTGPREQHQELLDCQPLMAGVTFRFPS